MKAHGCIDDTTESFTILNIMHKKENCSKNNDRRLRILLISSKILFYFQLITDRWTVFFSNSLVAPWNDGDLATEQPPYHLCKKKKKHLTQSTFYRLYTCTFQVKTNIFLYLRVLLLNGSWASGGPKEAIEQSSGTSGNEYCKPSGKICSRKLNLDQFFAGC